jgi:hypothetical protein
MEAGESCGACKRCGGGLRLEQCPDCRYFYLDGHVGGCGPPFPHICTKLSETEFAYQLRVNEAWSRDVPQGGPLNEPLTSPA